MRTKKSYFLFIVAALVGTGVFAEEQRPVHTVSFDTGPMLLGALFGDIAAAFADRGSAVVQAESSGFGFGVLYERRINDNFAVSGRVSYFGATTFVRHADMGFSAFAIEGQGRYYPWAGMFFVSGVLGYTRLVAHLHGRNHHGTTPPPTIPPPPGFQPLARQMTLSENYITLGANMGWRIDFGRPRGFVFEPSVGYSFALRIGGGDGFARAEEYAVSEGGTPIRPAERSAMNGMARHFLVGGLRVGLAFGWRF